MFIAIFLLISVYLFYFIFFESKSISANSYNRRLREVNENILRGSILDRKSNVLAKTITSNGYVQRKYVTGKSFSHVIGYQSKSIGSSGIEALYNKELNSAANPVDELKSKVAGNVVKGNSVQLTLDKNIQVYAAEMLQGKTGSIVVIVPQTGEVLAMVNKPDFNPSYLNGNAESVTEYWNSLLDNDTSPLLNRAAEGLYPPGSIFKVVVASALIKNNMQNMTINCTGKLNIDGYEITDSNKTAHGEIDLTTAFEKSCNSFFITAGLKIGNTKLMNEAEAFGFNKNIATDFKTVTSIFPKPADNKSLAQQSIGQGAVQITPLNAAILAATVANNGKIMSPYIVDSIKSYDGKTLKSFYPKQLNTILDPDTVKSMKQLMLDVVQSGTGKKAAVYNTEVAGKTGTAQNTNGKSHAWFIGFAPADNPKVAIAVIIENGGGGGGTAAPIAGKVLRKALKELK